MNLVYICNEYPPLPHGGIGTFVQTIAQAMQSRGHTVAVIGIASEARIWSDEAVHVEMLKSAGATAIDAIVDRWHLHSRLRKIRMQGGADVVEVPDFEGWMPFPLSRTVVRLHLSQTEIHIQANRAVPPVVRFMEYATLRCHRNWIAVSQHILDLTQRRFHLAPRSFQVIMNPATLPTAVANEHAPELPKQFVLSTGAVSERKGAYRLAKAACTFLRSFPELHLVYAGATLEENGMDSGARVRQIVGPELESRVHLLGRISHAQVAYCLQKAACYVSVSTLEAFGLNVAEAMLSGLACVLSDCAPYTEFARADQTALLVDPWNIAAISDAVTRILSAKSLSARIGQQAAVEMKTRFGLKECVNATEAVYKAFVETERRR